MKHKHCELIKQWADGAEIEMLTLSGEWRSNPHPSWWADLEYRIKPEEKKPVVRWLWITQINPCAPQLSRHFYSEEEANTAFVDNATVIGRALWSRTEFPE